MKTSTLTLGSGIIVVLVMFSLLTPFPAMCAPIRDILTPLPFEHYVEGFNSNDLEMVVNHIPNSQAWSWMKDNVPLFECSDSVVEKIYYFRWWVYRKHIRYTSDGFVITEFLPEVGWSGKHNTINCAVGHHINEGRWLYNQQYLDDYIRFWFRKGGLIRQYSCWLADAVYSRYLVNHNALFVTDLLPDMVENFTGWEHDMLMPSGLFWQLPLQDGMEYPASGETPQYRPTLNSYMYGDAKAIAAVSGLAGRMDWAISYSNRAVAIKQCVQSNLWDGTVSFFKSRYWSNFEFVRPREEIGFIPWYFNLPDQGYETAWKSFVNTNGFNAPFGLTTCELSDPAFNLDRFGWAGPAWFYATSQTLVSLANLLNNYTQDFVSKADYWNCLKSYAFAHSKYGQTWLGDWYNPITGVAGNEDDYNHSSYCDLVITGLVGLRPRSDQILEINPLVTNIDYFCLDNVSYHNRRITIFFDRDGTRYGKGPGLQVIVDGNILASTTSVGRIVCPLPPDADGMPDDSITSASILPGPTPQTLNPSSALCAPPIMLTGGA
jgi:hypothetical protein